MKNNKYIICTETGHSEVFYWKIISGFVALTTIVPTTFPNKKKAKRVLKRLNKYHGGGFYIKRL